jgi:hypothetical protein
MMTDLLNKVPYSVLIRHLCEGMKTSAVDPHQRSFQKLSTIYHIWIDPFLPNSDTAHSSFSS